MHDGPMDDLLAGFWWQVARDLRHGCPETRAWLDSDDFIAWCRWSFPSHEPAMVKGWLLEGWRERRRAA